ncbi:hypothetical protein Tco_0653723 [Tanacetum coccineum]|uniref:Reverse transcriptase domain-containing protein n=1 Tax=Tanacetum coccineum TaxID=301880 RepID=A0ABQ4X181_9ASTR
MNQVVNQGTPVARNANNERKWGINHSKTSKRKQNKRRKVVKAYTTRPGNKKGYAGTLPNCIKCKLHHTGPCPVRLGHFRNECQRLRSQNQVNQIWKEKVRENSSVV